MDGKTIKKESVTRRSLKRLKSKFLNESMKPQTNESVISKDLKLNINTDITKLKSIKSKTLCDEKLQDEDLLHEYLSSKKSSMYRNDVKLPPRNVVVDEPWPQPLLPPVSPQHYTSGAMSLPSRYNQTLWNARFILCI